MYVALTREVKEAWAAYDNAAEPEQRARRKERWQQLAIMQILLLQWRQALQNKLAAPGAMTFRLMSEEFLGPLCSRLQAVMLMELDVAASTCSRAVVNQNLRRLELEMLYPLEVPCCLELRSLDAIDEPEAFTWHGSETNQEDIAHIAAGICWLKKHLGQPEQDVVAVTNRSFLRARWQREGITIAGRKTDFVILTARALESLNLQPGQEPHAEALASMVKWIIALYESKTTKCLEERGLRSIWSQLVVQALAIKQMRFSAADPHCHVPAFGGDFNGHQILHHKGGADSASAAFCRIQGQILDIENHAASFHQSRQEDCGCVHEALGCSLGDPHKVVWNVNEGAWAQQLDSQAYMDTVWQTFLT